MRDFLFEKTKNLIRRHHGTQDLEVWHFLNVISCQISWFHLPHITNKKEQFYETQTGTTGDGTLRTQHDKEGQNMWQCSFIQKTKQLMCKVVKWSFRKNFTPEIKTKLFHSKIPGGSRQSVSFSNPLTLRVMIFSHSSSSIAWTSPLLITECLTCSALVPRSQDLP